MKNCQACKYGQGGFCGRWNTWAYLVDNCEKEPASVKRRKAEEAHRAMKELEEEEDEKPVIREPKERAKSKGDYSQKEITFIKNFYGKIPTKQIANKMGRTDKSIRCKAYHLGVKYARPVENTMV